MSRTPPHHWRPLYVTYHANRASCASCCTLLYLVALIAIPYVLAYSLGGLWTKEALVREQPRVRFRYEMLVEAHASTFSQPIVPLSWSTSQSLNDALGASVRPCTLRAWEEDDELDGFPDRLEFAVTMPLDAAAGERLLSASAIVGLEVIFARDFSLRLNASVRLEAASPLAGKRWEQTADLVLLSDNPQRSLDLQPRPACPTPTWAFQHPTQPDGLAASASSILSQYKLCNDTVVAQSRHSIWTPGVTDAFEARLTLRVPPQLTSRRPGLVETFKLALVQYIALFIPVAALLNWVYSALFRFGIVASRVHHPIKQHNF